MTGTVRIARLTADRLAMAGRLFEAAFGEPYGTAAIADLLKQPAGFGLIACLEEPAGYVVAATAADEAEILSLGVAPAHRRRGIGAALIRAAAEQAKAQGAATLFLEVAADNAAADALYRSLGFVQVGLRRKYYRRSAHTRVDARILSLKL